MTLSMLSVSYFNSYTCYRVKESHPWLKRVSFLLWSGSCICQFSVLVCRHIWSLSIFYSFILSGLLPYLKNSILNTSSYWLQSPGCKCQYSLIIPHPDLQRQEWGVYRVSLCNPGWPRIHYVDQAGPKFPKIHLPVLPECWDLLSWQERKQLLLVSLEDNCDPNAAVGWRFTAVGCFRITLRAPLRTFLSPEPCFSS